MKRFYPIFLDLAGRRAVVLGGGAVAARKAASLAAAGADVLIISPRLGPELARMASEGMVRHTAKMYAPGDLAGAFIVVAATDDPAANLEAADEARASGALINCVRPPEAGDFIVPSSIARGGLTIAISTGGGCPALARELRAELETLVGREYGAFLEFLEEARDYLKKNLPDEKDRREALTALVESDLAEVFREAGDDKARQKGREMLEMCVKGHRPG